MDEGDLSGTAECQEHDNNGWWMRSGWRSWMLSNTNLPHARNNKDPFLCNSRSLRFADSDVLTQHRDGGEAKFATQMSGPGSGRGAEISPAQ
ncbi:unnamed protein product [Sphagnum balticum]